MTYSAPDAQPPATLYPAAAPARYNVLAIVSLVTSLIGFHLVGIVTGHIALNQIKRTGEQGHGMALAGTIIGYAAFALVVVFFVIWLVVVLGIFATAGVSHGFNSGY